MSIDFFFHTDKVQYEDCPRLELESDNFKPKTTC